MERRTCKNKKIKRMTTKPKLMNKKIIMLSLVKSSINKKHKITIITIMKTTKLKILKMYQFMDNISMKIMIIIMIWIKTPLIIITHMKRFMSIPKRILRIKTMSTTMLISLKKRKIIILITKKRVQNNKKQIQMRSHRIRIRWC